jgi:hypothetical protein
MAAAKPEMLKGGKQKKQKAEIGWRAEKARFSETRNGVFGVFPSRSYKSFRFNGLQLRPPAFRAGARFSETRNAGQFFSRGVLEGIAPGAGLGTA